MPPALPTLVSAPVGPPLIPPGGEEPPQPPPLAGGGQVPPVNAQQDTVDFSFSADRNQLFTAWNALANLADLAGKVTITVHAAADGGFDQNKLENGVLEPLRETKLID